MRNLLFVFFVFIGMVTFLTHSMVFASEVNAAAFWLAVASFVVAMVVIGCWDLGDRVSNGLGWIFMIVISAFCILTTLPIFGGGGSLLKIGFFILYAAVGLVGFVREKGQDSGHSHGHAH